MPSSSDIIKSAFSSATEADTGSGKRPVIFDILGTDRESSLLPDDLKLVLHVNPSSMNLSYNKEITRMQTKGGFVEQHWGDAAREMTLDAVTGGFMRLYTGMSSMTSTKYGGGRRETIAYDKYLDLLALFHNNGAVHDTFGNIVLQGIIKITFDGGVYYGWFASFSVNETADKPYQFTLNATFTISHEVMTWRSSLSTSGLTSTTPFSVLTGDTSTINLDSL